MGSNDKNLTLGRGSDQRQYNKKYQISLKKHLKTHIKLLLYESSNRLDLFRVAGDGHLTSGWVDGGRFALHLDVGLALRLDGCDRFATTEKEIMDCK